MANLDGSLSMLWVRRHRRPFRAAIHPGRLGLALLSALLPWSVPVVAAADALTLEGGRPTRTTVPFVENTGQTDAAVAYYTPTSQGTVFVTRDGAIVYALPPAEREGTRDGGLVAESRTRAPGWNLVESFTGGRVVPSARQSSSTRISSFIGDQPGRWRRDVATYAEVELRHVYDGIDVALRATGEGVEKVFTVAAGARPERIRVRVRGARALAPTAEGELAVTTEIGEVRWTRPVAYQETADGARRSVAVAYTVAGNTYGFRVAGHDPDRPLVIDPAFHATYLGASGTEVAYGAAVHPGTGEVYVVGTTTSVTFPGASGGAQSAPGGNVDVFVARLSPDLGTLMQATYLGGSGGDLGLALRLNPLTGDVYVAGSTESSDLPGTVGGGQATIAAGADAFVSRLDATLTVLQQSSYLGGNDYDGGGAVAVSAAGDVYLAGITNSSNLPATGGGAQSTWGGTNLGDAFVTRFSQDLTSIVQTSYLGGSDGDHATAVEISPASGEIYLAGGTISTNFPGVAGGAQSAFGGGLSYDAFVARLNPALTTLAQATYLGSNGVDLAQGLALDPTGAAVYLTGNTDSVSFPGIAGGAQSTFAGGNPDLQDGFVTRLNGSLTSLLQSSYIGGNGQDFAYKVAFSGSAGDCGGVYVLGGTGSSDLPMTVGAFQSAKSGQADGYLAHFDATLGAFVRVTYLGGSGFDDLSGLALDDAGARVVIAGSTGSLNFPGMAGAAQPTIGGSSDAVVASMPCNLHSGVVRNPCSARKKLCVSKKMACLLTCHAKAEKNGVALDAACEQGCKDAFDGGADPTKGCFEKLEAKFPTTCLTYDDTAATEAKTDAFVTDVVQELDPGFPTPVLNKCSAAKKVCVRNKARGLLACHAKAESKGVPLNPACVQKARKKFDGGAVPADGCFEKLEVKYPVCLTYDDTAALEAKVDAFLDDVVSELDPFYATPTPTATPTVSPTPTITATPVPTCTPPYLVDNGDGTVTDHLTGLQWELKTGTPSAIVDCTSNPPVLCPDPHDVDNGYQWCAGTFPTCNDDVNRPPDGSAFTVFLSDLNSGGGFAGHTDWRLPTNAELQTVVDLGAPSCGSGGNCIESLLSLVAVTPTYLSADEFPGNTNASNCFNYVNLGSGCTKTNKVPVRAVRTDAAPCP